MNVINLSCNSGTRRWLRWLTLLSVMVSNAANAWWNEDWPYRKAMSFQPEVAQQAASLSGDLLVLVRLHHGNFNFFLDTLADGADIRFVAADDTTPLKFHIETYDPVAGIGLIWVRVPRPGNVDASIWMYYGNPDAVSASDPAATYSTEYGLVMHFDELGGTPGDRTAYGHRPTLFDARLQSAGLINLGSRFAAPTSMTLPVTPALSIDGERGWGLSLWLAPEDLSLDGQNVWSIGNADNALSLGIQDSRPRVVITTPEGSQTLEAVAPFAESRWYHVAVAVEGDRVALYVDGESVADMVAPIAIESGELVLGRHVEDDPGFIGAVDELRVTVPAQPTAWRLASSGERPEGSLVVYGGDETQDTGSAFAEYFGLMISLFDSMRIEGWIIVLLLCAIGIAAIDVILAKAMKLSRIESADKDFMQAFRALGNAELLGASPVGDAEQARFGRSGLFELYRRGTDECAGLIAETGGSTAIGDAGLQVVRSAMETALVEESDKLNARLVILTIAVSGGPFLGLLGTVLGVMVTFATIAQAGDVNVNTIAPGVAAALTTTVMGLIVAIPALFGYNFVAGRIGRRIAAMEVFIEQYMSKLARATRSEATGGAARHAA